MARTKFELIYPHDNSRKQIGCSERNSLLIANQIKQIGHSRYKFIGDCKGLRSFVQLAEWQRQRRLTRPLTDAEKQYLENLRLIWLLQGERELEVEQYPAAMEDQLDAMGFQPSPPEVAA